MVRSPRARAKRQLSLVKKLGRNEAKIRKLRAKAKKLSKEDTKLKREFRTLQKKNKTANALSFSRRSK